MTHGDPLGLPFYFQARPAPSRPDPVEERSAVVGPLAILKRAVRKPLLLFALAVLSAPLAGAALTEDAARALIAAQSERVAAAVARMRPQQPGEADVFYIGFAGYGGQAVFRKEADFGRLAFERRYDAQDRSLLLVNDEDDVETYPIASRTNLRHALRLIGGRMDPAEDVLVLLLTSHGSENEGIEVSNGSLPLAQLHPSDVRDALDEAGIRWRVVIASACYAGVFLPPLRDDSTLVLTAADDTHSSFGCDDERDLTWFGEALLRDALPGAASLEEAFGAAREIIAERERKERVEGSRPQIHVGPAIREKLAELEAARAGAHRAPAAQVN
jgi:hypothetical protein